MRLTPVEEQGLRDFLNRTKDYGFEPWDDAWGEMPRGHLKKFDCAELGRYDPAREDCPGRIPLPRVPDHSRDLDFDDPEDEALQRGEVIPVAERPTGPLTTVTVWERSTEQVPPRIWWPLVLVTILWFLCIYYLHRSS